MAKKWIQKAIKKKGSLTQTVRKKFGKKGFTKKGTIKKSVLNKLAKGNSKTAKRARLAKTLKKLRKK